jgi:hypothetical protein
VPDRVLVLNQLWGRGIGESFDFKGIIAPNACFGMQIYWEGVGKSRKVRTVMQVTSDNHIDSITLILLRISKALSGFVIMLNLRGDEFEADLRVGRAG